jgi:cytochrome c oxidase cbb3-type subunit 2
MGFYIKHDAIEKNAGLLLILAFIAIGIGGLVQIVPLFSIQSTIPEVKGVRPYSPLELVGRNIYLREGCYNCHSQMVRPFRDEVDRYGHYSIASESRYDHPFQWGSKRTGPDLARVGGKYSNSWQAQHLINPRALVPQSIMPAYAHLAKNELHQNDIRRHLEVLKTLGVPYSSDMLINAEKDLKEQASIDADHEAFLARYPKAAIGDLDDNEQKLTELDAIIAYLQVLGTFVNFNEYGDDVVKNKPTPNSKP